MASPATITEPKPEKFEPRTINFPDTTQKEINAWLHRNIESLKKRLELLHKTKVPQWRKTVDGKPREENKSWPFPNCSNVVHQSAGEAVDEIVAWVIQLIWISQPLVYFRYPDEKDEKKAAENSDKEKALATFIDNASFDPRQLDLYPYHNKWFTDSAGLGRSRICVAPEHRMEMVYTGYKPTGGSKGQGAAEFDNMKSIYEGPKPINLRYEDVLCGTDAGDGGKFEDNDPIFRRCVLNVRKIRERVFKGQFIEKEALKILDKPDRYGPDEIRKRENQKKGITDSQDTTMAEWDIYEGYFSWFHNGKKFRLISWYHLATKTMLNCVYNFIPDNQVPLIETRLSVDGKGFGEMLKDYQEEISTAKNQRTDAITYGMLGINTIDKQNKDIDRNFTLLPGMFIPAKKDAFQHYDMANPAMGGLSLQNEEAMISQAKARAGVDPPISGAGAGSMGKNKQFGSMGTMAVLQTSNSRSAHRTSGFRHSSVRLFALLTDFYGFMGLGDSATTKQALKDYLDRKMQIPVRAADASMNKEVTKQNEIILNQAISAYIKETSSLLQAYQNPGAGDEKYKKWLRSIIIGKTRLMQQIVKDFQLSDNPAEFIPNIELEQQEQPNAPETQAGQHGPVPLNSLAAILQKRGAGGGTPPAPGNGGAPSGLTGQGGVGGI